MKEIWRKCEGRVASELVLPLGALPDQSGPQTQRGKTRQSAVDGAVVCELADGFSEDGG